MPKTEKQTTRGPGRVHFLPWQQVDSTTAVALQALEESIAQEKNKSEEALETVQTRVRELENHLAGQKEVRPAGGAGLKGLQETEGKWSGVRGTLSCAVCPSLDSAIGRNTEDFKESHGGVEPCQPAGENNVHGTSWGGGFCPSLQH